MPAQILTAEKESALRDEFAAAALTALIASEAEWPSPESAATAAYAFADAMMAERSK